MKFIIFLRTLTWHAVNYQIFRFNFTREKLSDRKISKLNRKPKCLLMYLSNHFLGKQIFNHILSKCKIFI
jgi:hypothetical protein